MKDVPENEIKKDHFSWDKFNPEKFFAETDRVAKIFREVKEKNTESEKVELKHEG